MNKLGKLEKKVKRDYVMHTGGTSFYVFYVDEGKTQWCNIGMCIIHRSIKFYITITFQTSGAQYTQRWTTVEA